MKKRLGVALMTALCAVALLVPHAPAQEAETDEVRQGELAKLLVNVLGLYRFLPAAPTEQEAIAVLLANRIAPNEGWEPDEPVVLADLAEVIVRAIDATHEIEDPDNPQAWIDYLAEAGVPIDTIGLALTNVEPLPEPIAGNVFVASVTSDPLKKRAVFGQPDEAETGTDVSFNATQRPVSLEQLISIIEQVPDVPTPQPTPTPT